jgi:multidrug efflux system outer membrane protein
MRRLILVLAVAGCAIQPDYRRPEIELPAAWKESAPRLAEDGRWWRIYQDASLEKLVSEALEHNADLALAVARVDEARALAALAGSALLPQIEADFERSRTRTSQRTATSFPGMPREFNNYSAGLAVSYEVDLWGRLRNASGAARAALLASEAARDGVRLALGAEVAKSYFALRALDAQVELTRRTVQLREEWLRLQQRRNAAGVVSDYELRQLEAESAAVRAQLPPLERDRDLAQGALSVLLGRAPRAIFEQGVVRSEPAEDAPLAAVVPSGMPSELLLRRPDLVESEQRLIAANARVAEARAAYFPSIALTGFLGSESEALSNLFSGPAGAWTLVAAVAQPIFTGGRLDAQTDAARARERQALAAYQRAIQAAFREVREALTVQARARESFDAQSERAARLGEALRLARLRYENGIASQLDVLDAERGLLAAESARIEALRAQRAAVADLFRALGG